MATIRAFIAVEIDKLAKQKISNLIVQLKSSGSDVKWVNENQMHLTLKFLGNIEQDTVEKVSSVLKSIAGNFREFNIQFTEIGAFPNMHHPRVVWLGIDKGQEALKSLNNKIETGLEKLGFNPSTGLGTGKEKRGYKAHLTLGRVKSSKNIHHLAKLIDEIDFEIEDEIKIDRLVLFQSILAPKGAIYTPLAELYF